MSEPQVGFSEQYPDLRQADDLLAREREGQQLGDKWRLDRLLGLGGMAAVYMATHRNGHRAALKILHPYLSDVPEAKQRFLEESYAANRINHSGVVTIRDECTLPDGTIFLIMDLLEGETLADRYERCGCTVTETLQVADAVLDILVAAHSAGVVHRDIKPDNIFITNGGQVKLLDFGIAWCTDTVSIDGDSALGTPVFMAPEQASCDWAAIDGRTDLWSLGATLFLLLTGSYVHPAQTPQEELVAAMTEPVRPVRSVVPAIPVDVADIVDRALAFDKEQRFAHAASMRQAVRSALQAQSTSPPEQTQRITTEPAVFDLTEVDFRKPSLGRRLVAVLAAAALMTGGVLLIRSDSAMQSLGKLIQMPLLVAPSLTPDPLGPELVPHPEPLASRATTLAALAPAASEPEPARVETSPVEDQAAGREQSALPARNNARPAKAPAAQAQAAPASPPVARSIPAPRPSVSVAASRSLKEPVDLAPTIEIVRDPLSRRK